MSERVVGSVLLSIVFLFTGCDSPSNSSTPAPVGQVSTPSPQASPSPLTEFDEALRFVRNGQYTYIWVVKRKDGRPLDGPDGAFLRTNAPQIVDWVKADKEGTKFIGGTNFNLEEGNLELLKKRFVTEDYSGR